MRNYIQEGRVLAVTAPANVSSGDGVQVGRLFGVCATDALSGATVQIQTEGVFTLPKVSGDDVAAGAALYWNGTALTVTPGTDGKLLAGVAVAAAGVGVTSLPVKLGPVVIGPTA